MNKKQFVKELKSHLKHLQDEELKDVVADYEEHIEVGVSKGRDEKEVIKALGKPKTIAKHIIAHHLVEKAKKERSTPNILRAVLATVAVGFFNLVFVLGPFIGIVAVLFSLFVTGASLVVAGVAGSFAIAFDIVVAGIPLLAAYSFLIASIAIGGLVLIGSYYLSKLFGILTLKYLKLNLKIIKKSEGQK
jgi:uncharacterized membrane protein